MARPKKNCLINSMPGSHYFKPRGVPARNLPEVYLSIEGYEALRLVDHGQMTQSQAATQMGISRQVFGKILSRARQTVSKALVEGLALNIQGGNYALPDWKETWSTCEPVQKPQDTPLYVAAGSQGPALEDLLDPLFGRAAGFIMAEPETMNITYLDNTENRNLPQGAGTETARRIIDAGAKVLLAGYVGPKAFKMLIAAGIQIAQNLENLTVQQALERFRAGKLVFARQPNREKPWKHSPP